MYPLAESTLRLLDSKRRLVDGHSWCICKTSMCMVSEEKNKTRCTLPEWSGGISEKMKQIGRNTSGVVWAPGHPGTMVPYTQGIHSLSPGKVQESPHTPPPPPHPPPPHAHDCENSVVAGKA